MKINTHTHTHAHAHTHTHTNEKKWVVTVLLRTTKVGHWANLVHRFERPIKTRLPRRPILLQSLRAKGARLNRIDEKPARQ